MGKQNSNGQQVAPFTRCASMRYGQSTRRKRVPAFPGLFRSVEEISHREHDAPWRNPTLTKPICCKTVGVDPVVNLGAGPSEVGSKEMVIAAKSASLPFPFHFRSRASCSIWPGRGAYRNQGFLLLGFRRIKSYFNSARKKKSNFSREFHGCCGDLGNCLFYQVTHFCNERMAGACLWILANPFSIFSTASIPPSRMG